MTSVILNNTKKVEQDGIKVCAKCNETKPLRLFRTNKGWKTQNGKDAWCEDCVKKHCVDKESFMEYFQQNNRAWREDLYEKAADQAAKTLAVNKDYNAKMPFKRREILQKEVIKNALKYANLATYYEYQDRSGEYSIAEIIEQENALKTGDEYLDEIVWSDIWHGNYSRADINFLDDYYENLGNDAPLETYTLQIYAREIAKSALNLANAQTKLAKGSITVAEFKVFKDIFDSLNASAEFSEAKRKKKSTQETLGSFGELVAKIESSGKPIITHVQFPKDDVDKVTENLFHLAESIGVQGVLPDV